MSGGKRPDAHMGVNHHDAAPRTAYHSGPSASDTKAGPSSAQQVTPNQPILRSLTIEANPERGSAKPVAMDIKATGTADPRAVDGEAASMSTYAGSSSRSKDWRTQFYMMVHIPGGAIKTYICKIDTASKVNVLSQQVVTSLGMTMEPYYGGRVAPLGGGLIQPMGRLTLDWHVRGKNKTYETDFVVLDDDSTKDLDALLSEDTVGEIGFYLINDAVWFCESGDPRTSS